MYCLSWQSLRRWIIASHASALPSTQRVLRALLLQDGQHIQHGGDLLHIALWLPRVVRLGVELREQAGVLAALELAGPIVAVILDLRVPRVVVQE